MAKTVPTAVLPPALAPAGDVQSAQPAAPSKSPKASISVHSTTYNIPPTPTSLTSKEWTVPPRPKPGRKPATDAPPTKRKAQNRAAQRAFRERRAARVGELEEEIKKIEIEDEKEQNALRTEIEKLEKEVEEYRTSLNVWMQRCRGLEAELAIESAAKEEVLRSSREASAAPALSSRFAGDQPQDAALQEGAEAIGCGNCSSISDCRCIQEVINMQGPDQTSDLVELTSNKRPHSPARNNSTSKRIKPESPDNLETDFTTSFSNQPGNSTREDHTLPASSSAIADPCGFCTDGTACICAEMQAAEADNRNPSNHTHYHPSYQHDGTHNHQRSESESEQHQAAFSLPPRISQFSHITPPPSDTDVSLSNSSTLHNRPSSANPCIKGPGTCLQCRSDPNSTLFCKSLAKSQGKQQGGCCGANARGGDWCCQATSQLLSVALEGSSSGPARRTRTRSLNRTSSSNNSPRNAYTDETENPAVQPITLTCADAYTTLSRHPGYAKATGEMAGWLHKLRAHPATAHTHNTALDRKTGVSTAEKDDMDVDAGRGVDVDGRPAMEIDAANVMAVLRDFDRRFISESTPG